MVRSCEELLRDGMCARQCLVILYIFNPLPLSTILKALVHVSLLPSVWSFGLLRDVLPSGHAVICQSVSPVVGHSGCFQISAVINNVTGIIFAQAPLYFSSYSEFISLG